MCILKYAVFSLSGGIGIWTQDLVQSRHSNLLSHTSTPSALFSNSEKYEAGESSRKPSCHLPTEAEPQDILTRADPCAPLFTMFTVATVLTPNPVYVFVTIPGNNVITSRDRQHGYFSPSLLQQIFWLLYRFRPKD
jgi:hypothetical protein